MYYLPTMIATDSLASGLHYLRTKEVKKVYLAGPITGMKYGECTDWRQYARDVLNDSGIEGISPMRGKEYLEETAKDEPFSADGDKFKILSPLSTNRGIITRDRWDATRCDIMLVNFLGAKIASIGTVFEMAWANIKHTPIVIACEEDNIHWQHGFIKEVVGYRLDTLDKALSLVKAICQ